MMDTPGARPPRSRFARGRIGARLRRLLAFSSSLVAAALIAELACLAFDGTAPVARTFVGELEDRPSPNFRSDEMLGWTMRPSKRFSWAAPDGRKIFYCSGPDGFRRACTQAASATDTPASGLRVAIVGDSQSWGAGVQYEESYGALLGERLGHATVRNFALPGFGLDQVWQSVLQVALPWRPDLVVVGLFRSDFDRSLEAFRRAEGYGKPTFVLDSGRLRPQQPSDRSGALVRWLDGHSRLWTLMEKGLRHVGSHWPIGEWWSLNAALLDRIVLDCEAAGIPVVFVRIPHPKVESFETLTAHMAARQATLLDPLANVDRSKLYFSDGHLNPAGHRRIAEALHAWCRDRDSGR